MSDRNIPSNPVTPAKKVPHGWRRGEWLLYHHGDNGNHCLEPESFRRPRHSYSVDDIGLIWFTNKTDCDDWLRWWHADETPASQQVQCIGCDMGLPLSGAEHLGPNTGEPVGICERVRAAQKTVCPCTWNSAGDAIQRVDPACKSHGIAAVKTRCVVCDGKPPADVPCTGCGERT